ncbi:contactin-5-like [Ptychodera flava]|uniref:contactin-5-like n=1 Tax=Ptychodera flava TaxID=63121 RepID=UPI003969BDED
MACQQSHIMTMTVTFLAVLLCILILPVQVISDISISPSGLVLVKQGNPITLTCRVDFDSGDPEPLLSWYLNGVPLSPGNKYQILDNSGDLATTKTLEIRSVDESLDSGNYRCENSRPAAGATYKAAVEIVVYTVPNITTNGDQLLRPNDSMILKCEVTGNYKDYPVLWKKDGKDLSNSPGVYDLDGDGVNDVDLLIDGSLIILNASEDDLGLYECSVHYVIRGEYLVESRIIKVFEDIVIGPVKDDGNAASPPNMITVLMMAIVLPAISGLSFFPSFNLQEPCHR